MFTNEQRERSMKYAVKHWDDVCMDGCVPNYLHTHYPKIIAIKKCVDCGSDMKFLHQEIRADEIAPSADIISSYECDAKCSDYIKCWWERIEL